MASASRAEYFKSRREKYKTFSVEVEREKMCEFEKHLKNVNESKAQWLNRKIDEEIGKK